jgi:16S rRNA (adenine1518-N6/adenine1519-N6)-dimethyltransferase
MSQTKRDITTILDSAGLRPNKRLGQNFLIDGNLMNKVVAGAEIEGDDVVLEVGCGTGALTDHLVARAGTVIGVELDRGLAAGLRVRFDGVKSFQLLERDVLYNKSTVAAEVLDVLRAAGAPERRMLLVANLPYNIASPLMMNLLNCGVRFHRYNVVIQKEAAERLTANVGTREYGPLSIAMQACGHVSRVASLPAQAFWPAPQVASQAIRVDLHYEPFDAAFTIADLIVAARCGFAHRRKTLQYNLRQSYNTSAVSDACIAAAVDPRLRAEALTIEQWLDLARRLVTAADKP